jgi:hypothetical protein
VLKITEVEPETFSEPPGDDSTGHYVDRPGEVLKQLRLGHLNEEERREKKHAWDTMIFSTYLERY